MRPYAADCPWDLDPSILYLTPAQPDNELGDYERLGDALVRRGLAGTPAASGIVAR